MKLRKLKKEDEKAYFRFLESWEEEKVIPSSARFSRKTMTKYLKKLKRDETEQKDRVPAETYFLFLDNGEIAGAINCRYALNDFLRDLGGHIGYGISPDYRGHHCAKWMVTQVFDYYKERNIDQIMLTADHSNTASIRTIQACGGILESSGKKENGESFGRYWITL